MISATLTGVFGKPKIACENDCKDFADKLSEPIIVAAGHALRAKQKEIDLKTTRRNTTI